MTHLMRAGTPRYTPTTERQSKKRIAFERILPLSEISQLALRPGLQS
jgi:hypothetical protein